MVSSHSPLRPVTSSRNPLGAKPISSSSFASSAFNPTSTTTQNSSIPPLRPPPSNSSFSTSTTTNRYASPNYNLHMTQPPSQSNNSNGVMQPSSTIFGGFSPPMQPMSPKQPPQPAQNTYVAPNYSISLPPSNPVSSYSNSPLQPTQPTPPPFFNAGMGVLSPSKPPQPTWGSTTANKLNNNDWGDLDPLG